MGNHIISSLEKGNIKLIEYSDPSFTYSDRIFLQVGCCGLYLDEKELKDLSTIINYYLNIDELSEVKLKVGGEYVAP